MGPISATYELEKDLTIVTVSGAITADDLQDWGIKYYEGQITSLILWDVTKADLSAIRGTNLEELPETSVRYLKYVVVAKRRLFMTSHLSMELAECLRRIRRLQICPLKSEHLGISTKPSNGLAFRCL